MADLKDILANEDFGKVVNDLCVDTRENRDTRDYMDEYNGVRLRRPESVEWREPKKVAVYSDTEEELDPITGEMKPKRLEDKIVHVAKVITNLPKKIVRTSVAFMFGGSMSLTAENPNDGFNEFKKIYIRKLKMQSVLKEFTRKVLSETKAAMIFYPVSDSQGKSQLKVKILSTPKDYNVTCDFYLHFNEDDDMDAFIYKYNADIKGRTCECVKIYTKDVIYSAVNDGIWQVKQSNNRFGKIPVVYAEVDCPDWDDVANLMDKLEMRLSRLSDTNNYFSEPILKTYGLTNLPSKETVGKELNFSMDVDADTGTAYHGDADYLVWQQSNESVPLELDRLEDAIHSGASNPDLSINKLMGLGNLSGTSRRFMFIDAEIKASEQMEIFGPVVQRTVAIIQAGMANITHTKLAPQLNGNYIEVEFGSILPQDLAEELKNLETASQFNSKETIIKNSPYTDDVQEELNRKRQDEKEEANNRSMPGITL